MSLFFLQLRGELRKMFARKRTYIGFAAFLLIEWLLLGFLQLPRPNKYFHHVLEDSGYAFADYFSGLTAAFLIQSWTVLLLGSLFLALVSGDVVSKEVEEGTLRMMLCRRVSRGRIMALKFTACAIYTFALMTFISLSALLAGCFFYKAAGGLFVDAIQQHLFALFPFQEGLQRYLCAIPLLALSLMTISSLGFMLSCFNMKPAAASIVTLCIFLLDFIFDGIPYFESLKPYFLSSHMVTWLNIFRPLVPWLQMTEDYSFLIAVDFTFFLVGAAAFQQRDFKA